MMKKMILLAAIASITLASCVKNEMEVVDNDDQELPSKRWPGIPEEPQLLDLIIPWMHLLEPGHVIPRWIGIMVYHPKSI